jgi:hypothetical protein
METVLKNATVRPRSELNQSNCDRRTGDLEFMSFYKFRLTRLITVDQSIFMLILQVI